MLPAVVDDYLNRLDASRVPPFVVYLDRRSVVLDRWGDPGLLKLPAIETGDAAAGILPFLPGAGGEAPELIACLDPGTGHALDLHVLPDQAGRRYVVFISAEAERRRRAGLQQQANEARLLHQRQRKLIDQLVESRSELELRRREAEEALRLKGQFLATVSHEFRTPLTAVIGYAEWLASAMDDNEQARRQARAIARAGQHMVTLVDNILEQAKMEQADTPVHEDKVDLRQLAEDMAAIMAPLAADKGLAFAVYLEPQDAAPVILDEMRVRQVFINLIGNAVKFTQRGFVQLKLGWAEGELHAEVADSGPGIADSDRDRIFAPFARAKGAHRSPGAGLGLHITLKLVRLLGGSIELQSKLGEGSRFQIHLPAPLAEKSDRVSDAGGCRIVVAEDDADVVQLMKLFLTRAGFDVTFAADGSEAVERVFAAAPQLVLLDLNMPVLDGLGAVRRIRDGGYTGPVVALTGATLDEDRLRAIEAGFDGFVTKPIRMPELIATLQGLIA